MKRFLLAIVMLLLSSMALAAVNINTATKEELDALPGVGPVKAQAIIDYRNANGRFKSLEDLKKVNGIGDATFEKLKPDITLTGKTTPVATPAKSEPAKAPAATPAAAPAKAEPAKTAAPAPAPAAPPRPSPPRRPRRRLLLLLHRPRPRQMPRRQRHPPPPLRLRHPPPRRKRRRPRRKPRPRRKRRTRKPRRRRTSQGEGGRGSQGQGRQTPRQRRRPTLPRRTRRPRTPRPRTPPRRPPKRPRSSEHVRRAVAAPRFRGAAIGGTGVQGSAPPSVAPSCDRACITRLPGGTLRVSHTLPPIVAPRPIVMRPRIVAPA